MILVFYAYATLCSAVNNKFRELKRRGCCTLHLSLVWGSGKNLTTRRSDLLSFLDVMEVVPSRGIAVCASNQYVLKTHVQPVDELLSVAKLRKKCETNKFFDNGLKRFKGIMLIFNKIRAISLNPLLLICFELLSAQK